MVIVFNNSSRANAASDMILMLRMASLRTATGFTHIKPEVPIL